MYSSSLRRVFSLILSAVILSTGVALAVAAPPDKTPVADFAGTRAGQVRSDNGPKINLVWCPAESFLTRRWEGDGGDVLPTDQVQMTLSQGFWLGQHEATQAEWQNVMGTAPWSERSINKGNEYPATYVGWSDAMKFCEKLTAQERDAGRLPDGWKYTLPTEAQWEHACRAGTKTQYSFGDDYTQLGDYAWFDSNANSEAHRVCQKKANPWGLFDMHGNVWEWCRDYFAKERAGGTDPTGPPTGRFRVCRGGSWATWSYRTRSSTRTGDEDDFKISDRGFRVALVRSGK
jgi:formylglycine-generating enzyme required for sulfatase activity